MRDRLGSPSGRLHKDPAAGEVPGELSAGDLTAGELPAGEGFLHLELNRTRGLTVVVPQQPLLNSVAQVREQGSTYPVEILSTRPAGGGFELNMDYLWEGRRREERVPATGDALLERKWLAPLEVEVVNVSSGGMQLFSAQAVTEGCAARVCGAETESMCLIRCCAEVPGGYRIGLQFYGENRKEDTFGNQQLC